MKARVVSLLLVLGAASVARAEDPCDGFAWDVSIEWALFARQAQPASAGATVAAAPTLTVALPYSLSLVPQAGVRFAVAPAKKAVPAGAHGGLAATVIAHAGRFRISLDAPAWIDVVAGGQSVPSQAFQGRAGCSAPHKVVEFELPAGVAVIQLSAAPSDHVLLTVTETAPPSG